METTNAEDRLMVKADSLLDNLEADDSRVYMTLVDYAQDDIKQLCRHMISNYYNMRSS